MKKELEKIERGFSGISSAWTDITGIPANVSALGALTGAADEVPYFTGLGAMALASLTPYARTILACANAAAARTALGLGVLAVLNDVDESDITLSDITTLNVSTIKHGFAPKGAGTGTLYLDDTGGYSTPSGTGGFGSPATLTDTVDLGGWYSTDDSRNTVGANTGIITTFFDRSGNGRHWTPGTGTIIKQYGGLAGLPVAFFAAGITATASITLPLKGALSYWAILKVTSTANYQNLFGTTGVPTQPSDLHAYWDQPTNKWQIDGQLTPTANVAGRWIALVVHYFNSAGAMHMIVRENGAQVLGNAASTNGLNPIQGTAGSPVNYGIGLWRHPSSGLPFTSQVLEWGFYVATRNGSEATLESYMRARSAIW